MTYLKTINIPIYDRIVKIYISTPSEFKSWFERKEGGYIDCFDNCDGATIMYDNKCYLWFDSSLLNILTIVHETTHATYDLLEYIGIDISDQEAFCYLQGYILKDILKWIFSISELRPLITSEWNHI